MTLAACLLVVVASLTLTMPPNAATRVRALRRPPDSRAFPTAAHLPVAAALLALLTLGPAAAVAVVAVTSVARAAARRRAAASLARANAAALPGVCRVVAAELRAGAPPTTALTRAADDAPPTLGTHLRRIAAAAHLGDTPADLWVAAPGTERLHALAALWSVAAGSGAGLADGVERLADALSAEHRLHADTAAQLAGPRASAAVLAALPLLGLALAATLGARPLAFLTTPLGFACLAGAVALDATGVWWVCRLTHPASTPLAAPR